MSEWGLRIGSIVFNRDINFSYSSILKTEWSYRISCFYFKCNQCYNLWTELRSIKIICFGNCPMQLRVSNCDFADETMQNTSPITVHDIAINYNSLITYVVKGLMPSNSARYTKSVELHYKSGKMKTRRFLLLRVSC